MVKILKSDAGALLFETFIALMILSVGIVKALTVFSQALHAKQIHAAAADVQAGFDRLLFEWNAAPGARITGERLVPYHHRSEDGKRRYTYEMSARRLPRPSETPAGPAEKSNRGFYDVNVRVTDSHEKEIGRFETVLFAGAA